MYIGTKTVPDPAAIPVRNRGIARLVIPCDSAMRMLDTKKTPEATRIAPLRPHILARCPPETAPTSPPKQNILTTADHANCECPGNTTPCNGFTIPLWRPNRNVLCMASKGELRSPHATPPSTSPPPSLSFKASSDSKAGSCHGCNTSVSLREKFAQYPPPLSLELQIPNRLRWWSNSCAAPITFYVCTVLLHYLSTIRVSLPVCRYFAPVLQHPIRNHTVSNYYYYSYSHGLCYIS